MSISLNLPKPQPKQKLFLKDTHKHICFGGARGGGKSWALRIKAILLCLAYPGYKFGIVRTTYPELEKNHIEPLKKMLCGTKKIAAYNESKKEFRFGNGSIIYMLYCASKNDCEKFSGIELDSLGLDEATHFQKDWIDKMRACVRGANDFPKHIFYTANPDGVGMQYIRRLFIERKFEIGENPEEYTFIQSLLTDNTILMEKDPTYLAYLESLPGPLKSAWLEGRWDVFEGSYFSEFRETPNPQECYEHGISIEQAKEEHRWTHVIEPFDIPIGWKIYRSYDWGYGKPFSCAWFALDYDNTAYRILELYGCTRTPNEGVKWSNKQQFDEISRIEREHPWLKGKQIQGVADPSIWDGSHGISAADEAEKHQLWFEKGINDRVPGWMQIRERLKFDEEGYAKLYFFSTCKAIIRCMPLMMFDEHKIEDLDTSLEDHTLDDCRYFCMMNPIAPRLIKKDIEIAQDPLNQFSTVYKGLNNPIINPNIRR